MCATGLNGTRPRMQPTTGSMARAAMPARISQDTGRWIGRVSPSQRPATEGPHDRIAGVAQDRRVALARGESAAADERELRHAGDSPRIGAFGGHTAERLSGD
jgi:hypothetical protein